MTDQARLKEINLKRLIPELIPTPKHLIQHHLKSFNYLLTHSFPKIIKAKVNNIITSEVKPHFKLRYRNIKVLKPTLTDNFVTRKLFPHECRLRDIAYSGEIKVDIEIINDEDGDLLNKVMEQVTIAASWPSNNDAAVTNLSGGRDAWPDACGSSD